ncbi:MAG: acylneuraminate cytidylyltransferase family protein [bacterium]
MRTICFIFARGGSKGIPRKNLQDLGGKPLLAHSIICGLALSDVERVVVSTDDEEIAEVARCYGAEVPFIRPLELAGDTSSEFMAWKHAVGEMTQRTGSFDWMLSLPATSPLRSSEDVQKCLIEMAAHPLADAVITVQKAIRNPHFNMVKRDQDGFCRLVCAGQGVARRQDTPEVFDVTTVAYLAKTSFVINSGFLFEGNLRCVEIPKERAVDIDDALDLEWARFLLKQRTVHEKS